MTCMTWALPKLFSSTFSAARMLARLMKAFFWGSQKKEAEGAGPGYCSTFFSTSPSAGGIRVYSKGSEQLRGLFPVGSGVLL